MKKPLLALVFLGAGLGLFAQRLSIVGIPPFEAAGGSSPGDAASAARQVIDELKAWGTLIILEGEEANNAEYIIRGKVTRQGSAFVLSADTVEVRSGRVLNASKEEGASLSGISIFSFCAQAVENIPYPNYLLGTWQSVISTPEGPLVCIIEFRSDRTVRVERYDTWERRQNNFLKYEGYGTGGYAYAGYVRRTMTIRDAQGRSRQSPVDATISVNLTLEETLPEQTALSQSGLRLLFDDPKTAFEIVSAGLPCGRNYDENSSLVFTRFTKIRQEGAANNDK
jgi:hypothetical protein